MNLPTKYIDKFFRKKTLEQETVKLFLEISKNYDLFVDVGSCFGYYTLLSEARSNIAIEPDKFNFRLLEKTITENKIKNTTLYNYAIAGKFEERIFYRTNGPTTHTLRKENLDREEKEIIEKDTIKVITLDELLEPFLSQKILFKIDIEGLEAEAFEGMKMLFQTNNIDIIVEYNNNRYTEEDFRIIHDVIKDFDITYLGIFKDETKKITFDELLKIKDKYYNIFLQQRED